MRRAAAAAACLALIAALAPLPGGVGASAAQPCAVWKKHSKRVVKHVRRDGERKRVVRVKRWRTCAKRVVPTPSTVTPVLAPAPAPQPEPENPSIPRLGVKAVEWSYTLSRPDLPAGEVIVELNNMGEDPHNLNLQLEGGGPEQSVPVTGPAGQSKAKFDLPAGSYRLWCSLDGHEAAGMTATLVVTPP
jgi:plastocyanin